MIYSQIQPPDSLKAYVRYGWILADDPPGGLPKTFRPLADGCPGLMIQQTEKSTWQDQHGNRLPGCLVYGQSISHQEVYMPRNVGMLGVCFYPNALKSIFGFDADALTDTCTEVNELARRPDSSLSERLLNTDSPTRQLNLIFSFLLTQISHNTSQQDSVTEYALTQMIQSKGNSPVSELWQSLNVSERTLERKFRQSVGISPKLFARICRFQASLTQLRSHQYDKLSDIAFENGYADQSHFIRAFSEFSGFSPAQYQKKSHEVVANFPELIG